MPEDWYRAKYGPGPGSRSAYDRPVSVEELVGIHWFNHGNEVRDAGDLAAAEGSYTRAVLEFPAFAEAHASLGAVRQSCGERAEAEAAYREAARLRPDLPGLAHNLELLKQQPEAAPTCFRRDRP
jgi:Flp pilus assembly protein TadD